MQSDKTRGKHKSRKKPTEKQISYSTVETAVSQPLTANSKPQKQQRNYNVDCLCVCAKRVEEDQSLATSCERVEDVYHIVR